MISNNQPLMIISINDVNVTWIFQSEHACSCWCLYILNTNFYNPQLEQSLKMHCIFNMHDIVFIIFQMVYVLIVQEGPGGLGAFAALSTISSTISEAVLQLLWKKLSSMEPLIYLLPYDLIQEYKSSDGVLKLVSD